MTGSSQSRGVSAEVGEDKASIDLTMNVGYGVNISEATEAVRKNVIDRVENLTGLKVTEVNVTVNDVDIASYTPPTTEAPSNIEARPLYTAPTTEALDSIQAGPTSPPTPPTTDAP